MNAPESSEDALGQRPLIDLDKTWADLTRLGCLGQIIGAIACAVTGTMLGAIGVVIWIGLLHIVSAAIQGQGGPETIERDTITIFKSVWLAGFFGLLPGAWLGSIIGMTNRKRILAIAVLVALAVGYISQLAFGYPVNLLGIVFYAGAPLQAVWFAGIGALLVKIKLGLAKIDEVLPSLKSSTS